MKPLVREWIRKAEADFTTALRESRARKSPNYDAVCFHAQQCAEKYMKALLQEAALKFPKTHALEVLLDLLGQQHPQMELLRPSLRALSILAVQTRYPGMFASKEMGKEAIRVCKEVRLWIRKELRLH